jgi:hypothetical protein
VDETARLPRPRIESVGEVTLHLDVAERRVERFEGRRVHLDAPEARRDRETDERVVLVAIERGPSRQRRSREGVAAPGRSELDAQGAYEARDGARLERRERGVTSVSVLR